MDDAELLSALTRRLQKGKVKAAAPSSLTIAALWARYWREHARHQKSSRDKKRIGETLVLRLGERDVLSLSTSDCEDYRDWRREKETRLGGPAKAATLNRELSQLRHMLNWGVRNGLFKYNPIAIVKLERENNARRTILRTEASFQDVLKHCNQTIRALAITFVDSGPRRMEVINLRWDEFDHHTGVMDLFDTKNDEPRRPRLSKRSLKAILELPRLGPYIFANWRKGPWFGKRLHPTTALRHIQKAFEIAGVPAAAGERWNIHLLRHQFVRRSRVRDKLPEKTVMKQTGHKTRVVFDRYGIGDDDELDGAFKIADANIDREVRELRKGAHRQGLPVDKGGEDASVSDKLQVPSK